MLARRDGVIGGDCAVGRAYRRNSEDANVVERSCIEAGHVVHCAASIVECSQLMCWCTRFQTAGLMGKKGGEGRGRDYRGVGK